jgi:tetratricopeptide (TPR) repeat protein
MKTPRFSLDALVLLAGLYLVPQAVSQTEEASKPDIQEVRQVIYDAAPKIEARYGPSHEEALGLADRVRELIGKKKENAKPVTVVQKLANEMHSTITAVSISSAEIGSSTRGFEYDTQAATLRHRVLELKAEKPSIQTWAELWELTHDLQLSQESARYREALLKACQQAVRERPGDADAHAWLADAHLITLDRLSEAEKAAREALKLDARHLRARLVMLSIEAERLFYQLAGLDTDLRSSTDTFLERLVTNRPSEPTIKETASRARILLAELDVLESDTDSDLAVLLRSLGLRLLIEIKTYLAETLRDIDTTSVDEIVAKSSRARKPVLRDVATLRKALRLAADDSEAYASIFLKWASDAAIKGFFAPNKAAPGDKHQATATLLQSETANGRTRETEVPGFVLSMPDEERKVFEEASAHLTARLRAATGREAVLIHETFCRMDVYGLSGGRLQFGTRHLLEGLRLDPTRILLLELLYPLCQGEFEDDALSAAVFEMLLVVDPSKERRQSVAALVNSLGLHRRADELLERCLREEPEDYMLWNQKVVFMLKRDSTEEGLRKAAAVFEKVKEMPSFASAPVNNKGRLMFVRNYILFQAMQGLWEDAIGLAESYLNEGIMPGDDARELLKSLRALRPPSSEKSATGAASGSKPQNQ